MGLKNIFSATSSTGDGASPSSPRTSVSERVRKRRKPTHSSTINSRIVALLLALALASSLDVFAQGQSNKPPRTTLAAPDPQHLFEAGEAALRSNKLDEAERDFREVLAIQPNLWGAHANLGVIAMRRKQWPQALSELRKAEKLAPEVAGVRLNIGLVYFRQNDYARAIAPFESVVQQSPDSYQARYLLGLCYFFNDRWADTIGALEPLWAKASDQLNYLYALDIAAYKTKNAALEEKAAARMVEIGADSAEFHLLTGKAHLNREEYDDALKDLQAAAGADPKLPFVHFNLGLAYLHEQDYKQAGTEFRQDIRLEPDVPFNYEQLGALEATAGNDGEAAKNYRAALKLDPRMTDAWMGVAKIEERQHHYAAALADLDHIVKLNEENAAARYLRGQVLLKLGREKEGREELSRATKMLNQQRATRHKELEGESVPSPELAKEPE